MVAKTSLSKRNDGTSRDVLDGLRNLAVLRCDTSDNDKQSLRGVKLTLGERLKQNRKTTDDKGKTRKFLNMTIRRIENERLQEDFDITMRRLREDTIMAIDNERQLPKRKVDFRFTISEPIKKNFEKCLDPVVVNIWNKNKTWAEKNGLSLKIIKEKDDNHVFEWYTMFFDEEEKKK